MSSEQSVTRWLRQVEAGNEEAANQLWNRYFQRLVVLARSRLRPNSCSIADEEDVALSVLRCLYDGAVRGQFSETRNRDELWRLLVTMTHHKAVDHARNEAQQKRGRRRIASGSVLDREVRGALHQLSGRQPSPELLVMLAEQHQRLLALLDNETLRQVALWKLDGYKNEEIAAKLGLTRRSIERKLQQIRQAWSRKLES